MSPGWDTEPTTILILGTWEMRMNVIEKYGYFQTTLNGVIC